MSACPRNVHNHLNGCTCTSSYRMPDPAPAGSSPFGSLSDTDPHVEIDVVYYDVVDNDENDCPIPVPFVRQMSWSGIAGPDNYDDGTYDADGIPNRARREVEAWLECGSELPPMLRFSDLNESERSLAYQATADTAGVPGAGDRHERALAYFAANYDDFVRAANSEGR